MIRNRGTSTDIGCRLLVSGNTSLLSASLAHIIGDIGIVLVISGRISNISIGRQYHH